MASAKDRILNSNEAFHYRERAVVVILLVFTVVTAIVALHNLIIRNMVDLCLTLSIVIFNLILYSYFAKYKKTTVVGSTIFWMMAFASIFLVYEHHFNSTVIFLILSPLIAFLLVPVNWALIYVVIFELMVAYLFYWGYQHYAQDNSLVFSMDGLVDYIFATLYLFVFWLFYHYEIEKSIKRMRDLNREKSMLLQELHHRVKNNFNLMVSLLKMQHQHADSIDTKTFIDSFQKRVESIVLTHELLYVTNISENIDLSEYIPKLTNHIKEGFLQGSNINIEYSVEKIAMSIDEAIYLGIIINELLVNSFKYAFIEYNGRIQITIKQIENSEHLLEYRDNGSGLANGYTKGFGTMVIKMAIEQLKGDIKITNSKSGLDYQIRFKG